MAARSRFRLHSVILRSPECEGSGSKAATPSGGRWCGRSCWGVVVEAAVSKARMPCTADLVLRLIGAQCTGDRGECPAAMLASLVSRQVGFHVFAAMLPALVCRQVSMCPDRFPCVFDFGGARGFGGRFGASRV
jgi:hypothetical protein